MADWIGSYSVVMILFIVFLSPLLVFPRELAAASDHNSNDDTSREVALATDAVAVLCVLALLCVCVAWCCAKKTGRAASVRDLPFADVYIKAWTATELRAATNGFDAANIIGSGSGSVCFKGMWEKVNCNQRLNIAIKTLDINGDDGEARRRFQTEIKTVCKLRHRNLVKVLGYSVDEVMIALVMEYMEKGSLEDHLHGKRLSYGLSWDQRLNVAMDVAEGLVYLHHECVQPIIHCDLKPRNILLGSDMVAKISDFGIAKLLEGKAGLTITNFRGTFGYVAPEYAGGYHISTKADVYSYGVLLMELVTGLGPMSEEVLERGTSLPEWVEGLVLSGKASKALMNAPAYNDIYTLELALAALNSSSTSATSSIIVDSNKVGVLKSNGARIRSEAERLLRIAVSCTRPSPKDRPTMKVVKNLLLKLKDHRLDHGMDDGTMNFSHRAGYADLL